MRAIHSVRHRLRLVLVLAVLVVAASPPPVPAAAVGPAPAPGANTSGDLAPPGPGVAPIAKVPKGQSACPDSAGKHSAAGAACSDSAAPADSSPGKSSLPKGGIQCASVNGKQSDAGAACSNQPAASGSAAAPDIVSLPAGTSRCPSFNGKHSGANAACTGDLAGARSNSSLTVLPELVAGWSVSISDSNAYLGIGKTVTLTATSNQDVGPTVYYIEIYNQTSGALLNACGTGTSCTATFANNSANQQGFVAYVAGYSVKTPPPTVAAVSGTAYTTWVAVTGMSASPQYLAPTGKSTITVSANVNVGPTPWYLELFDATTGAFLAYCGTGSSCSATVQQNTATIHKFVGYISNYGNTNPPTGVQSSGSVYAYWMSLSISASSYGVAPGGTTTLTASTNTDVGPSPYWLSIFDGTTGTKVTSCASGSSCSGNYTVAGSAVRDFWAYIGGSGTTAPPAPLLESSANYAEVVWISVSLVANPTMLSPNGATQLTASASMSVYNTAYYIAIFDTSVPSFVTQCGNGSSCATSVTESNVTSHNFIAYVDEGSTSYVPANIRAQTPLANVSWITVSLRACNYAVASCPANSWTNGTVVNAPLTLTASTQYKVDGTGYSIQIQDPTGAIIGSCSTGTSCSAHASEASPNSYVFGAQVSLPNTYPMPLAAYATGPTLKWVTAHKPWAADGSASGFGKSSQWDYSDDPSGSAAEYGIDEGLPTLAYGSKVYAPESGNISYQPSTSWWEPGRVVLLLDSGGFVGIGHVVMTAPAGHVNAGAEIAYVACNDDPNPALPQPNCSNSHVEFMYSPTVPSNDRDITSFRPPSPTAQTNGCPRHPYSGINGTSVDPCAWLSAYLIYGS